MVIWIEDSDSRPYDKIKTIPRPGHSDYPAMISTEVMQIIEGVVDFLED